MIKIHRSKNKQFYFTIESKQNGKILATSETYTRKSNCINGIVAVAGTFRDKPYSIFDHSRKDGNVRKVNL